MKIIALLNLLLLVCSCVQDKPKEVGFSSHAVPPVYTLKYSSNISVRNDTVFLDGKKYSGYLFELHANSLDTFSIQAYVEGLQGGIETKWFPNKKIMERRSYSSGKKNGLHTVYWENGNKKFEFTAKDDAYEGELKEWNVDGKLIHLANYKNGQESGPQKMWYDNGKIRANYVIIDGKRYGLLGTKNCINVSDSIFYVK